MAQPAIKQESNDALTKLVSDVHAIIADQLPRIGEALDSVNFEKPAKLAISIAFKPAAASDEPSYVEVDGKSTLPSPSAKRRAAVTNGQVELFGPE